MDQDKQINCRPRGARTVNPYTIRTMIKDTTTFVGRAAELQQVYTLLAAMQGCSIVGPRRIGKSSLLYQLTQPNVYLTHLSNASPYVFAFIDLQELTNLEPSDFFFAAVERLCKASQNRLKLDPEQYGNFPGFRRFLMYAMDSGLRLVLCCDEFEMLSQNSHFGADFYTYLRGLSSNYDLALVTSSRDSLFELCHLGNLQTSQFWNIFVEQTLGLMPEIEAHKLICEPFVRAGGTITAEDVAFVLNLAGRHPFYIQIACYYLFNAKSVDRFVDYYDIVEQRFLEEARRYYTYNWEQLDQERQMVLLELCNGRQQALDAKLFNALKRDALVVGVSESPSIMSAGWKNFILTEAQTKLVSNSLNTGNITLRRLKCTAIPPNINKKLQKTLVECDCFSNDRALRALFIDTRLSPWRNTLPSALSPAERVRVVVDFLYRQYNQNQENALVLLLYVLRDQTNPDDVNYHYFSELANDLKHISTASSF